MLKIKLKIITKQMLGQIQEHIQPSAAAALDDHKNVFLIHFSWLQELSNHTLLFLFVVRIMIVSVCSFNALLIDMLLVKKVEKGNITHAGLTDSSWRRDTAKSEREVNKLPQRGRRGCSALIWTHPTVTPSVFLSFPREWRVLTENVWFVY